MTLDARIAAFKQAYGKWPASWPHLVTEGGRDVLYATWLIGNDYRATSKLYGAYPPGYLARVLALFPDVPSCSTLHVFSGSLPERKYWRLDSHRSAEIRGSVYEARALVNRDVAPDCSFPLQIADPPYSAEDAAKYGTPMINRGRALRALAEIAQPGGHLVWLDTVWPMHRKVEWVTVGRIAIVRSTNHRVRMATIFERQAA